MGMKKPCYTPTARLFGVTARTGGDVSAPPQRLDGSVRGGTGESDIGRLRHFKSPDD